MLTERERIRRNTKLLLPQVRGRSPEERRQFYAVIAGGPIAMMFAAILEALKREEKHRE
jgi:hypothetical protein